MQLLTNNPWRTKLSRCIDEACEALDFHLAAFVYMPEHVHLLVGGIESKEQISTFLKNVKQPVSVIFVSNWKPIVVHYSKSLRFGSVRVNKHFVIGKRVLATTAIYKPLKRCKLPSTTCTGTRLREGSVTTIVTGDGRVPASTKATASRSIHCSLFSLQSQLSSGRDSQQHAP